MTGRRLCGKKLLEEALGNGGRVSLAGLLAELVPVQELRRLAKAHGLSPKGGYRIDRAPGYILAPLMIDTDKPRVMQAACVLLAEHLSDDAGDDGRDSTADGRKPAGKKTPAQESTGREAERLLALRQRELDELREELQKARDVATRQRQRLEEQDHGLQQDKELVARMRAENQQLRRKLAAGRAGPVAPREQTVEIHELERDLEELTQVEAEQRHVLAARQAEIRRLEDRVCELEPLVPKGRRKKKEPPAEPPPLPERFRRPYFTPAFYKSLENKDRRAIEAAYRAILLFCTEGPGYPGLQVKQLEAPIWSFRAALKLRVYFTNRADGDVDILELADRQEQSTVLRRLREKQ